MAKTVSIIHILVSGKAAKDRLPEQPGQLILSTFAGASRELMEALIINPFDARATADTIDKALRMPRDEQAERMHLMREHVRENNVFCILLGWQDAA